MIINALGALSVFAAAGRIFSHPTKNLEGRGNHWTAVRGAYALCINLANQNKCNCDE